MVRGDGPRDWGSRLIHGMHSSARRHARERHLYGANESAAQCHSPGEGEEDRSGDAHRLDRAITCSRVGEGDGLWEQSPDSPRSEAKRYRERDFRPAADLHEDMMPWSGTYIAPLHQNEQVRSHYLLALEPAQWEAVLEMRRRPSEPPTELYAHAAESDAAESLCGLPVIIAEPVTRWSGWLEDEWGPLRRCPTCDGAAR